MGTRLEINNLCISCDNCFTVCPEGSIITNGIDYAIEEFSCTLCHICINVCPVDSIKWVKETNQ